jgi:hypothetical protein
MYANPIPMGKPFDKGKYIEGKLKPLKDMSIALTKREMQTLDTLSTPREIDKYIGSIINNRWS